MTDEIKWIVESLSFKYDKITKRLWILCIILIIALIGTNAGWIYYESQWQYVESTQIEQEVEQDTESGSNTFVGGDYYGETSSENDN